MAKDEYNNGLSHKEIRNEINTFVFAGHDTTNSSVVWTLVYLAKHPECQEKVFQEVDSVFKDKDYLDWEDLNSLPYTVQCIKVFFYCNEFF